MSDKLKFSKIDMSAKDKISPYLYSSNELSCETAFVNFIIWKKAYSYEFAEFEGGIIIRFYINNHRVYYLPYGDVKTGVELILENDSDVMIAAAKGLREEEFSRHFANKFVYTPYRDAYEYIYLSENLATLAGKKFHSKRNHVASFSKKYDWEFRLFDSSNLSDAEDVAKKWFAGKGITPDMNEYLELETLPYLLQNREELCVLGGVLYVDGQAVAYTLGSKKNNSVFVTHTEKALPEFPGAYAVINQEFAKYLQKDYVYINREDDLGLEGLRRAKLSYNPDIILEKFICTPKI